MRSTRERSSDEVELAPGALAPVIVGALLVAVRGVVDNTNIALALVVVVVPAGALGGHLGWPVAAVITARSFNLFSAKPLLSLRIASADDVQTMTLPVVIGLIAGQVAAVARRRGRQAALQGGGRGDLAGHRAGGIGGDPEGVGLGSAG